jgi:hypothetical protein
MLLAELAAGNDHPLLKDLRRLRQPSWVPRGPVLKTGVTAVTNWLEWRARGEL